MVAISRYRKLHVRRLAAVVVLAAALTATSAAVSEAGAAADPVRVVEPGALDAEFGGDGRVDASEIGWYLVLADAGEGRLLVGSGSKIGRFTRFGRFDASFGDQGVVELPTAATSCAFGFCSTDLAALSNGQTLTMIQSSSGTEIWRFKANGAPDDSFGEGGRAVVPINAGKMLVNSDGSVVLAGSKKPTGSTEYAIALARVDAAGAADASFGGDGIVETNFRGNAGAVAFGPLGKVVVVGDDAGTAMAWRFTADGVADASFGEGGSVALSRKPFDQTSGDHWHASSVSALPNGGDAFGGDQTFVGCTIKGAWDCTTSHAGWISDQGAVSLLYSQYAPSPSSFLDSVATVFSDSTAVYFAGSTSDSASHFVVRRFNFDRTADVGYGIGGSTIPVTSPYFAVPTDAVSMSDGRQIVALRSGELVGFLGRSPGVAAPYRQITEFGNKLLRTQRRLSVAGLASPSDVRVEVALRWVEPARSRRKLGCRWYDPKKQEFRRRRLIAGDCETPRYFELGSGQSWRFSLTKKLRVGRYRFHVRAVSADGLRRTPFTHQFDGYRTFAVRHR